MRRLSIRPRGVLLIKGLGLKGVFIYWKLFKERGSMFCVVYFGVNLFVPNLSGCADRECFGFYCFLPRNSRDFSVSILRIIDGDLVLVRYYWG